MATKTVPTQQELREAREIADKAVAIAKSSSRSVRLDAWRATFEKTNRIMSGKGVRVQIVPRHAVEGSAMEKIAGWSDGTTINFNGPMVEDMLNTRDTLGAVLRLKGLNYHELCHVLYTPRMTEELPKKVVAESSTSGDPQWWYAFNALEDQRIETWFTTSYGPSSRYFEASVLQWLITDGNAEVAVLLHGRKYLSPKIRVQAEAVFAKKYAAVEPTLLDEFKVVIDEYLTVVLPYDSVRAFSLVQKYYRLLKRMQTAHGAPLPKLPIEDNGVCDGAGSGANSATTAKTGRVSANEAKEAVKATKKAIAKAKKDDKDAEQDASGGEGDTDTGQSAEGKSEGSGEGTGGSANPNESGDDGDGAGASESQSSGGSGASATGASGGAQEKSVADMMRDLVDEARDQTQDIREDESIQEDVKRTMDAVKSVINNGKQDASGESLKKRGSTDPEVEALVAQRRIRKILTRIRTEVEPQVLRRQESGRLDIRRLLHRRPNETDIFTAYDEGMEDETGMEVVVLLDISGSMQGTIDEASVAVWTLKRAFDALAIRCTVLAFDTDHYVIYQPGEKAKSKVSMLATMGGTDPTSALGQAQRIFSKSHAPSKMLVTITDGAWQGNDTQIRSLLRAMHANEVSSMLLGLGNAFGYYGKHDHHIGHDLTSISDMPRAVTKVVSAMMRQKTNQGI